LGVLDAAGVSLIDLSAEERLAAATSGDGLFWDGAHAVAANGGVRPNLSAGRTFVPGTNIIHLSETFGFADALMSPDLAPGEVIRRLHPVEAGMFRDLLWEPASVAEPPSLALVSLALIIALAAAVRIRRRSWQAWMRSGHALGHGKMRGNVGQLFD
jgi:hypothetical protein